MYALANIVNSLFNFYWMLILAWCILSWFPMREGGLAYDIATVIDRIVSPFMNLFRRFIPALGGIDFSPIIAILVLNVIQRFVVRLLLGM